jgi:DNA topoisomerase-1
VIRYSRKTKEQYVQSEIEGKASGWKAFYQEPNWVEEGEPKKPSTQKKRAKAKKGA